MNISRTSAALAAAAVLVLAAPMGGAFASHGADDGPGHHHGTHHHGTHHNGADDNGSHHHGAYHHGPNHT